MLTKILYEDLNARQKESFNFQKISAVLADYGFVTLRLTDVWQGADFLARHINGEDFRKVQLKGRFTIDCKYRDKDLWIGFRYKDRWYLYPHDSALKWACNNTNIFNTKGWENDQGAYTYSRPTRKILEWLKNYWLIDHSGEASSGGAE